MMIGAMRFLPLFAVLGVTGTSLAADPVQWRTQDGGNGHWYQFVRTPSEVCWTSAKNLAESAHGHLAVITSAAENTFVTNYVAAQPHTNTESGPYIGATCEGRPWGSWYWVTGEPFTYTAWNGGEPNSGGNEQYVHFWNWSVTLRWNDTVHCSPQLSSYIVEYEADCNNDGIVDLGQIRSGQLADANANNIPDVCEAGIASCTSSVGIAPATPLRDLDQGEGLVVGIKPDGTLISWGSYTPSLPSGQFKSVTTGRNCAIAIRADGTLVGFGANEYGRLNVPPGIFSVVSAADASWHAAGIRSDGSLLCWGYNNNGQCNVPAGSYIAVAAGGHEVWSGFTVAVRSDGTLAGWGNNTWGQAAVPGGSNFRSLAAGYYHALALRNDNTIAGWGWNANGQSTAPSGQFVQVACGSNESVALRANGTVLIFGSASNEVVSFSAARTDCTKVQVTCCGGAVALVSTDCDSNGAFDAVEIAAQPSRDQNANGILDTCEAQTGAPMQWRTAVGGNGHWYQCVREPAGVDWESARQECQRAGGYLATIHSPAENQFAFALVGPASTWAMRFGPWLGGLKTVSGWQWVTGEPWTWTNWEPGEPNNVCPYGEDRLHYIHYHDQWNDLYHTGYCGSEGPVWSYIIEWSSDCNNDGIVDFGQILDGTLVDANHNGVPDVCECPGDIDHDGFVGAADLVAILTAWGGSSPAAADLNADGIINGTDMSLLLAHWGMCTN